MILVRQEPSINNQNEGPRLIATIVVFFTLATSTVAIRFLSRKLKRAPLSADDYLAFLALLFLFALGIIDIIEVVDGGLGRHGVKVSIDEKMTLLKLTLASEVAWSLCLWAVKMSSLVLFARVFAFRSFRIASHAMMAIVTSFTIGSIIYYFLQCKPISSWWNFESEHKCGINLAGWLSTGIISLVTDLMVLVLPMPILWKLQLPRVAKAGVMAIFGIGLLICVFSALRIKAVFAFDLTDPTYTDITSVTYSFLEAAVAVICASALLIRPVIERIVPKSILARLSVLGSAQHGRHNQPNLHIDDQSEKTAGHEWCGESGNLDSTITTKFTRHSEDIWPLTYRINDTKTDPENLEHLAKIGKVDTEVIYNPGDFKFPKDIHVRTDWKIERL